jgi:hypothetical protein
MKHTLIRIAIGVLILTAFAHDSQIEDAFRRRYRP